MAKTHQNDLGRDSIPSLLLKLSVPAILAQLVNALYNIVDRMYIGHIPNEGVQALTGLGLCFPIIIIISAFAAFVGMGGAPYASMRMGEKDNEGAEKIMGNCLSALVIISAVLTVLLLIFKRDLLFLFGASENTIEYADSYLGIYILGTIFVQFSLGLNAFINAQGFATIGMATVLIGAVTNIVLDPVFIFVFHMGVQGAALATILSQAVSAVWVLLFLTGKRTSLRFRLRNLKPDLRLLGPVFALGLSPFIMQATEGLVNIVLNASLQRYGGDLYVGAMTILSSVMQVVTMPMTGLGQGLQPIVSYNFGAKKFDRVRHAFKLTLVCSFVFSFLMWGFIELFPQVFIAIFNKDPSLTQVTIWAMRIFMAMVFMMAGQFTCQQVFVALGQAKISIFLALLRKVILLIPLALVLPHLFGLSVTGVFLAEPIADFCAAATTMGLFAFQFPKILKAAGEEHRGKA